VGQKLPKGRAEIGKIAATVKQFEESDDATNFKSFTLRQSPRPQVVDQREFCLQFSRENNGAEFTRADPELGLGQNEFTGILNRLHFDPSGAGDMGGSRQSRSCDNYLGVHFG
jgi:hypothetical protein